MISVLKNARPSFFCYIDKLEENRSVMEDGMPPVNIRLGAQRLSGSLTCVTLTHQSHLVLNVSGENEDVLG